MPTSSIFTNVKITDPKKAEAFINALDEAANVPYEKKERGESHILKDHDEIRKLMEKGLEELEIESKLSEEDYRYKAFVSASKEYNAQYQIILGYNEAVTVLFNEIKNNRGSVDLLFYPMFFCARHSVELQLKLLIRLINDFNIFRKSESEKAELKGHNLEILSEKLNNVLEKSDGRLIAEYKKDKVKSLLSFFNKYDSTSQSFRYAVDNKGERLLDDSIDILEHLNEYWDLFKFLEWIEEVISELYKEYRTKTYTKKLSRNNLELIAKRLPDKKEWDNQVFLDERERIKQDFNLSSNSDFNKALDVIKTNPFLCSLVGMEIPEDGFSDEFFLLYGKMKETAIKRDCYIGALSCKKQGLPIIYANELSSNENISGCTRLIEECISRLSIEDCVLFNTYRCIKKYCEEYDEEKEHFSKGLPEVLQKYTNEKMTEYGLLHFEEGLQLCGRITVLKKLGIPSKNCIDRSEFVC